MRKFNIKLLAALLLAASVIALSVTSCKKDDASSLKTYLTGYGPWELASLQAVHFKRNSPTTTDTLAIACSTTTGTTNQSFSFTFDGMCSYTNFQCNGTYTGPWNLNVDSLILHVPVQMKDTASKTTGHSYPFANAEVIQLGGNSLVLRTGETNAYYADDKVHTYYRYSFIHTQANK